MRGHASVIVWLAQCRLPRRRVITPAIHLVIFMTDPDDVPVPQFHRGKPDIYNGAPWRAMAIAACVLRSSMEARRRRPQATSVAPARWMK